MNNIEKDLWENMDSDWRAAYLIFKFSCKMWFIEGIDEETKKSLLIELQRLENQYRYKLWKQ